MKKLHKYMQKGNSTNGSVIVEDKEFIKTNSGEVVKVENAPKHEDNILSLNGKNHKVPKNKGGLFLNNTESVISATHENRKKGDKLYTYKDEEIKLMPVEVKAISTDLNLPVKLQKKAISPAKFLDLLLEKRDNTVKKYKDPIDSRASHYRFNAIQANKAILATIPSTEDLYDLVFDIQQSKKSGEFENVSEVEAYPNTRDERPEINNFLSSKNKEKFINSTVKQQGGEINYGQVGVAKSDNTNYRPQLKSKFLLQQKKDLEEAKNVMNPKAEKVFRNKYGMSSNQFRRANEPGYAQQQQQDANKNTRDVLRDRSINADDYVAHNNQFMFPNLSGKAQANLTNQTNEFIAGELLGLGAEKVLSKIFKIKPLNLDNITQQSMIDMRKSRLLEQESKFKDQLWKEKDYDLVDKLKNANKNHNYVEASSIGKTPSTIGTNLDGKTFVYKDAEIKGVPLTDSQKALIAPHEVGHYYRNGVEEGKEWLSNFNTQTLDTYLKGRGLKYADRPSMALVDSRPHYSYGDELRERAAQLKDYIQIKNNIPGNFQVTEAQLDGAIKNYIPDTGLDNHMTPFFNSLKDKKGLLNTMNKYALTTTGVVAGASQVGNKQTGGKTKLKSEPYMKGSRPALGTTSSGKSIEVLDGRTISMDDIYDRDSVTVNGNSAKTFYKSKLKKYIK